MIPSKFEELEKEHTKNVEEMMKLANQIDLTLIKYPKTYKRSVLRDFIGSFKENLKRLDYAILENVPERRDLEGLTDYDSEELDEVYSEYMEKDISYDEAVKKIKEINDRYIEEENK